MIIISFSKTTEAVKARRKSVTRREWNDDYAERFKRAIEKSGGLAQAWSASPHRGGKRFGTVKVHSVTKEPTRTIPDSDWEAEGFAFMTENGLNVEKDVSCEKFWRLWRQHPTKETWVVRFVVFEIDGEAMGGDIVKNWPKLSETLPTVGAFDLCGNCGTGERVTVWQECDEHDQPTTRRIALCSKCSDEIIEPHPRLYEALPRNVPLPGAMAVCVGCAHGKGLACLSPLLRLNGGPGLPVRYAAPGVSFVDGRDPKTGKRWGRQVRTYAAAPTCDGREAEGREA